jgi:microcin C transport system substrate-binding protein
VRSSTSRIWATRYDFDALKDGRVKREVIPDETPSGGQGWFFNTRREKFKDPRFREALNYAFDFEWTNKNIMYGSYQRTHSVFQNSDMMAVGKPSPEELALLEPFRGQVSEEVFGEPFVPPVSDGSGQDRALLRKASAILQQAGLSAARRQALHAPRRERITIEFLLNEHVHSSRITWPLVKNMATLGIEAAPAHRRSRAAPAAGRYLRPRTSRSKRFSFLGWPGDSLAHLFQLAERPPSRVPEPRGHRSIPVVDRTWSTRSLRPRPSPRCGPACKALVRVLRSGRTGFTLVQ